MILYLILMVTWVNGADFVKVHEKEFVKNGKPYYFMGTNFWYGMNLAADNPWRLGKELDKLKEMGINNLRIMGSSQGPYYERYRMSPPLEENSMLQFNETVFLGLDRLLFEMKQRKMLAVIPLNNFWHWSGGFAQLVHWYCDSRSIPYPHNGQGYERLVKYISQFYTCSGAMEHYKNYFAERVNKFTGVKYKNDETIMAWQLANEPWPANITSEYTGWLLDVGDYIKKIDANHLLSIGIEGALHDPSYEEHHKLPYYDYMTCHLWPQNWGWYDPKDENTFENAKIKAKDYLKMHKNIVKKVGKPFVLEEFGLARDNESYLVNSTTKYKDKFYELIFEEVYEMAKDKKASGVNFWAWAGFGRPNSPGGTWYLGDEWVGDPPHEPQGWYSVYDNDTTNKVIKKYAAKFSSLHSEKSSENLWILWISLMVVGAGVIAFVIILFFKRGGFCKKSTVDDSLKETLKETPEGATPCTKSV